MTDARCGGRQSSLQNAHVASWHVADMMVDCMHRSMLWTVHEQVVLHHMGLCRAKRREKESGCGAQVVRLSGASKFCFAMDCRCGCRSSQMGLGCGWCCKIECGQGMEWEFLLRQGSTCMSVCEANSETGSVTVMLSYGVCDTLRSLFCVGVECVNHAFLVEVVVASFEENGVHGVNHMLGVTSLIGRVAH